VRVERIQLRDFRNYEAADVRLADGLTVVAGANGAGKTNLLEAVYFGCTARSPRTSNERELVRRGGDGVARVVLDLAGEDGEHRIEVGFQPGEAKHLRVDDSPVDSLAAVEARPLVSVFLPERLELVKGAPAARRAHLDQVVAALWPSRAETRTAYSRALAQRNALVARIRGGRASAAALDAWDAELARHGVRLMADRDEAVKGLRPLFGKLGRELGLPGDAELRYRPRSEASDAEGLVAELAERRAADLDRGFTAHGPHRDELQLLLGGVGLRAYGSQGQQRAALLALLFAERALLAERRARPPLMLLDDVMSELDAERRELLAGLLRSGGQSIVTTTEPEHVPGSTEAGAGLIRVEGGVVRGSTRAVAA
jgi:DNA replication and repair protein RecF